MSAPTLPGGPPVKWNVSQVADFLCAISLQVAAKSFSDQMIDGAALLELTQDEAKKDLGLALGQSKALFREIGRLKAGQKTPVAQNKSPPAAQNKSAPVAIAQPSPSAAVTAPTMSALGSPRSSQLTIAVLDCGHCGANGLSAANCFSKRQRKLVEANQRAGRATVQKLVCNRCSEAAKKAETVRKQRDRVQKALQTQKKSYLEPRLHRKEMAGYRNAGVLPMRKAAGGGIEIMLAVERRSERSSKRPSNGGTTPSSPANTVSRKVRGLYFHPIGGPRKDADQGDAVVTAAREFGEKVGHVLPGGHAAAIEAVTAACSAEGSKVLWVGKKTMYALFVYEVPEAQVDVPDTFAKAAASPADEQPLVQQEALVAVKWVRVAPDGSVPASRGGGKTPRGGSAGGNTPHGSGRDGGAIMSSLSSLVLSKPEIRKHLAALSQKWGGLKVATVSLAPSVAVPPGAAGASLTSTATTAVTSSPRSPKSPKPQKLSVAKDNSVNDKDGKQHTCKKLSRSASIEVARSPKSPKSPKNNSLSEAKRKKAVRASKLGKRTSSSVLAVQTQQKRKRESVAASSQSVAADIDKGEVFNKDAARRRLENRKKRQSMAVEQQQDKDPKKQKGESVNDEGVQKQKPADSGVSSKQELLATAGSILAAVVAGVGSDKNTTAEPVSPSPKKKKKKRSKKSKKRSHTPHGGGGQSDSAVAVPTIDSDSMTVDQLKQLIKDATDSGEFQKLGELAQRLTSLAAVAAEPAAGIACSTEDTTEPVAEAAHDSTEQPQVEQKDAAAESVGPQIDEEAADPIKKSDNTADMETDRGDAIAVLAMPGGVDVSEAATETSAKPAQPATGTILEAAAEAAETATLAEDHAQQEQRQRQRQQQGAEAAAAAAVVAAEAETAQSTAVVVQALALEQKATKEKKDQNQAEAGAALVQEKVETKAFNADSQVDQLQQEADDTTLAQQPDMSTQPAAKDDEGPIPSSDPVEETPTVESVAAAQIAPSKDGSSVPTVEAEPGPVATAAVFARRKSPRLAAKSSPASPPHAPIAGDADESAHDSLSGSRSSKQSGHAPTQSGSESDSGGPKRNVRTCTRIGTRGRQLSFKFTAMGAVATNGSEAGALRAPVSIATLGSASSRGPSLGSKRPRRGAGTLSDIV